MTGHDKYNPLAVPPLKNHSVSDLMTPTCAGDKAAGAR